MCTTNVCESDERDDTVARHWHKTSRLFVRIWTYMIRCESPECDERKTAVQPENLFTFRLSRLRMP